MENFIASAPRRGAVRRSVVLAALAGVLAALTGAGALAESGAHAPGANAAALRALASGPQRSAANSVRDRYRHPFEVLTFFGVPDNATVVEIEPGGAGYWTEILAPYLKDHGRYVAANLAKDPPSAEAQRANAAFAAKIAADPADYAKVEVSRFDPGVKAPIAPGAADFVLTFRNVHNWMAAGDAQSAFAAFFNTLRPGGVLGVVEHRASSDQPQDPLAKSGYVRPDYIVALAQAAGFRYAGASEANANPKDTKDYPAGVWTLPPTYRLKDQDRAKYEAIGESDRATLKFVKPEAQ